MSQVPRFPRTTFVRDQREAASIEAAARWRHALPASSRDRRTDPSLPAFVMVLAAITAALRGATDPLTRCAHVDGTSYLGPVTASLRYGLLCDQCQAAAECLAPPRVCCSCGEELTREGHSWPLLHEVAGTLVWAVLCTKCWEVDP